MITQAQIEAARKALASEFGCAQMEYDCPDYPDECRCRVAAKAALVAADTLVSGEKASLPVDSMGIKS